MCWANPHSLSPISRLPIRSIIIMISSSISIVIIIIVCIINISVSVSIFIIYLQAFGAVCGDDQKMCMEAPYIHS